MSLRKRTSKEADDSVLSSVALLRIRKDILHIQKETPPGIFVYSDEATIKRVHAIIKGVEGTPYSGGYFYFIVDFPNEYPIQPPAVKFMTTGGGMIRFNPNLYKNGKVCLSILGTWSGPQWSPAQHLTSVLISIQSLLNEKPFLNEPGIGKINPKILNKYNDYIRCITMEIGIVDMLNDTYRLNLPSELKEQMERDFLQHYDNYINMANTYKSNSEGKTLSDNFNTHKVTCNYACVIRSLIRIKDKLVEKYPSQPEKTSEEQDDSDDTTSAFSDDSNYFFDYDEGEEEELYEEDRGDSNADSTSEKVTVEKMEVDAS